MPPAPSVLAQDALTTLSNLKDDLGIGSSDISKDNRLERCINRATQLIEQITQRKLKCRNFTNGGSFHATTGITDEDYIYFDGTHKKDGGNTLKDENGYGIFQLPAWPVRANSETGASTFQLAGLDDRSNSGGETWDTDAYAENDDYIVDRQNGVVRLLGGAFEPGQRNYRIRMTAGYLVGTGEPYVPADLEGVCIELAKTLFRESSNVQSESIGTWSRSYNLAVENPFLKPTLDRYSRICL